VPVMAFPFETEFETNNFSRKITDFCPKKPGIVDLTFHCLFLLYCIIHQYSSFFIGCLIVAVHS
jgi:hypothetical protein